MRLAGCAVVQRFANAQSPVHSYPVQSRNVKLSADFTFPLYSAVLLNPGRC